MRERQRAEGASTPSSDAPYSSSFEASPTPPSPRDEFESAQAVRATLPFVTASVALPTARVPAPILLNPDVNACVRASSRAPLLAGAVISGGLATDKEQQVMRPQQAAASSLAQADVMGPFRPAVPSCNTFAVATFLSPEKVTAAAPEPPLAAYGWNDSMAAPGELGMEDMQTVLAHQRFPVFPDLDFIGDRAITDLSSPDAYAKGDGDDLKAFLDTIPESLPAVWEGHTQSC